MERKRYLELCQKYAMGQDIKVKYNGALYRPWKYELGFDNKGQSIHTAILYDINANSIVYCKLRDVKEEEK